MIGANTTITTYRMQDSSSVTSFSGSATVSGAAAYIESLSPEVVAVLGIEAGIEVFNCHVDPGDYVLGDKVIDASSNEYRIAGIERHENNEDTDDLYVLKLHKKTVIYND